MRQSLRVRASAARGSAHQGVQLRPLGLSAHCSLQLGLRCPQLPVGLVSLALGGGVFLWLRQAPARGGVHRRRRGRLRDRFPGNPPPTSGNEA
jgi:hypothetical protein